MASRRIAHPASTRAPQEAGAARAAEVCSPVVTDAATPRVRVLVIAAGRATRERLAAHIAEGGGRAVQTDDAEQLPELLACQRFDVVLVSTDIGEQAEATARLLGDEALTGAGVPSVVLVCDEPSVEAAVAAMRAGATDMIPAVIGAVELMARLDAAAYRARARRVEVRRVRRLKRLCRRLNSARREVVGQIESLCDDLAGAYEKMSDQMTRVAISSEFNSLVRQELDVEGLLRTVLEYSLARVGPTNAAVFLPTSTGEHTLGAYVNYDVPRDAAEVLLDHLTTVVPHRFESLEGQRCFEGESEIEAALGEDAHWLEGRTLVVMPCRKDGQTLAIVAFFRDASSAFTASQLESCEIIADLFGKQIGRVVQCHHRHLPMDEWGLPGDAPRG